MKKTNIIFIALFLLLCSYGAMAQGPDGLPGDPDVPIDGGLSLLVAAGVGYGAKKIKEQKKKSPKQNNITA